MWWKSLAVALIAFVYFAQGVRQAGVASTLVNPVDQIRAQDESIYANAALRMAAQGNWLTPIVMGRIYLYKPPMLEALAGLSLKTFGISLFALRLPDLLAAAAALAILFAWSLRTRGLWAGLIVVLLLLSNSSWVTLARLCYTDMLLACFTVAAMFSIARDPLLERPGPRWIFILSAAAAIMTKSVAGVLPLLALGLFALTGPGPARPPLGRVLGIVAWVALCVAPWHFYQLTVHRQWFWTDYVEIQLLQFGMRPAASGSLEIPAWFYLKRLFLTDPFLCIAVALALPAFIAEMLRRNANARLLACWIIVIFACISLFQYRNFPYALMLVAPLSLITACSISPKYQALTAAALALILTLKLLPSERGWSLTYPASRPLAAAPLLRAYSDRGRSNELILIDTDDEFYSSTLPLPKVRYCFEDPRGVTIQYAPYYVHLGITVNSDVFANLDKWEPLFRQRLRAWGLDSSEPIATAIVAKNGAEIAAIIRSRPDADFYLPVRLGPAVAAAAQNTHALVPASTGRFFLLANRSSSRVLPRSSMLQ